MTFEAFGGDGATEPNTVCRKVGAVGPGFCRCEIRDGQLKDPLILPIQIALCFAAGADDDVEAMFFDFVAAEGFLVVTAVAFFQDDLTVWAIRKLIDGGIEGPEDGAAVGGPRGQGVGGVEPGGGDVLVAGGTGRGRGKRFAARIGGFWRGLDAAGEDGNGYG